MNNVTRSRLPYIGPRPFERRHQDRFFGRTRETSQLLSLVIAQRTVLLYAPSGAGKTSLLNAGLIPALEREGFEVLPIARVQGPMPDPALSLEATNPFVLNTLISWAGKEIRPQALLQTSISQFLRRDPPDDEQDELSPRILILDQFEELFTAYPAHWKDRAKFFEQITSAQAADPLLHVLFVMREDYVAELDPYLDLVRHRLRTRTRLACLRPRAALAAVQGPLAESGRSYAEGVAEELVRELRHVHVTSATGERVEIECEYIEPVQLQVVCQSLWRDLPPDVPVITQSHLQEFGNVDEALGQFYERAILSAVRRDDVGEVEIRDWFERKLITPAGTRGTVYRGEETTDGISNDAIDLLVNRYVIRGEDRSGARWYELTHDRFIEPIVDANARWRKARQTPVTEAAREWERLGRDESSLLRGRALDQAVAWMQAHPGRLNELEQNFVSASLTQRELEQAERERRRRELQNIRARAAAEQQRANAERQRAAAEATAKKRLVWLAAALVVIALLAAGIAGWANNQSQVAVSAQGTAEAGKITAEVAKATAVAAEEIAQTESARALEARKAAESEATRADTERAEAKRQADLAEIAEATAVSAKDTAEKRKVAAVQAQGTAQFNQVLAANAEAAAEAARGEAVSRALAAAAIRNLDLDPECSTLLAIEAVSGPYARGEAVTGEAENALHAALQRSRTELALTGHISAVHGIAFSPDGTRLATAGQDGTVRLWDAGSGAELSTELSLQAPVHDVAFSPDGTRLATAGGDSVARVWDAGSGRELLTLEGHSAPVYSVAFASNGEHLATTSADGTAIWWEARSGQRVFTFPHGTEVWSAAVQPDGRVLVTAGQDGRVRAWNLESGGLLYALWVHPNAVRDVAFSPDGQRLATASLDNEARVWDTASLTVTLTLRLKLSGHRAGVASVAFSPDGTRLATGSFDRTAKLWDATSGRETLALAGHTATVWDVAFDAMGTRLASASEDSTARVWNLGWTEARLSLPAQEAEIYAVHYSRPDGRLLVSAGGDDTVQIWDAASGRAQAPLSGHSGRVMAAAFAPDGTRLVTAGWDGTARVWRQENQSWQPETLFDHGKPLYDVVFYPSDSGPRLATAGEDRKARIWDAHTGNELQTLVDPYLRYDRSHALQVTGIAVSPDGTKLATCSYDKTAKIWDAHTGEQLHRLPGHDYTVWDVAFSHDGKLLATGSTDGRVKLWDVETGHMVRELLGHTDLVRQIAFSPDGKRVATASFDGRVKVWKVATWQEQLSLSGHGAPVRSVAFSPDGRHLAAAGKDGTIRVYTLDLDELMALACSRVTRNLTAGEWALYVGPDVPYQPTCVDGELLEPAAP